MTSYPLHFYALVLYFRVQEGICYHLYSRARQATLEAYPLPEIQRISLEEVILRLKILKLGKCKSFLTKFMDPPDVDIIDISLNVSWIINPLLNCVSSLSFFLGTFLL